ncbi:hypothetical protein Bbelb_106520 [Branchiostoma belcheri]|nr:hypothetical protein Bbelb_106520 [Branchiostoma belcheri]
MPRELVRWRVHFAAPEASASRSLIEVTHPLMRESEVNVRTRCQNGAIVNFAAGAICSGHKIGGMSGLEPGSSRFRVALPPWPSHTTPQILATVPMWCKYAKQRDSKPGGALSPIITESRHDAFGVKEWTGEQVEHTHMQGSKLKVVQ